MNLMYLWNKGGIPLWSGPSAMGHSWKRREPDKKERRV
jgi:hypothetical protein